MRYVDLPGLRTIQQQVNSSSAVDQRLDARFELYNFLSPSQSPISQPSLTSPTTWMISCINETYPDANTRHLNEQSFLTVPITACVNYINQTLGAAVERRRPELLSFMWNTIKQSISGDITVYECTEEFLSGSKLWSFLYLWVSASNVLVIGCRSKSTAFKDSSESETSEQFYYLKRDDLLSSEDGI
jgi:Maf1 regulator